MSTRQEQIKEKSKSFHLLEAVQYSYYEKYMSKPLFDRLLQEDPTNEKYFGRWIIETYLRNVQKPCLAKLTKDLEDMRIELNNKFPEEKAGDVLVKRIQNNYVFGTEDGSEPPYTNPYTFVRKVFEQDGHSVEEAVIKEEVRNLWDLRDEALLERFLTVRGQLPKEERDIMSYKSFTTFAKQMARDEIIELADKIEMSKVPPEERTIIYKDDDWLILQPLTERASRKYGANTKWCTAAKEHNRFSYYSEGEAQLIIFIHKVGNENFEKYQIYVNGRDHEWKDEEDQELDEHNDLVSLLPEEAKNKLLKYTTVFDFLGKEKFPELVNLLLDTDEENHYLTDITKRFESANKLRTFYDGASSHYLSEMFGPKLTESAFNTAYHDNDYDQDAGQYAYDDAYNRPWDYLDEEPENADEAEDCSVCEGTGFGLAFWDSTLNEYSSTLTKPSYDDTYNLILNKKGEAKAKEFEALYREIGGSYHVINNEQWRRFLSDPSINYKCRTCDGMGKEAGKSWKKNEELWSEDQKEQSGQEAEAEAQKYALDEAWRDFDRNWDESSIGEETLDNICKILRLPNEWGNIPREDRVTALSTLLNMAGDFGIKVPIPDSFFSTTEVP